MDQVDDVVQEALLSAWRKCPRELWRAETAPQLHRLLRVVVRRLAINWMCRLERDRLRPLDAAPVEARDRRDEEDANRQRGERLGALLNAWLEELRANEPDNYQLIQGRYFADRKIQDLATDLGLSPNAVSHRLARLFDRFRARLLPVRDDQDISRSLLGGGKK